MAGWIEKQTDSRNISSLYLWVMAPTGKQCLAFAFYFSLRLTHTKYTHRRGPKKILHVFADSLEQKLGKKRKRNSTQKPSLFF